MLLSGMPASGNNVIYGYLLLSSGLYKAIWVFQQGPVCPSPSPDLNYLKNKVFNLKTETCF